MNSGFLLMSLQSCFADRFACQFHKLKGKDWKSTMEQ